MVKHSYIASFPIRINNIFFISRTNSNLSKLMSDSERGLSRLSIVNVWQGSEYASGSECARALNMVGGLNMLRLQKVLYEKVHRRFLIEFWICLKIWISGKHETVRRYTRWIESCRNYSIGTIETVKSNWCFAKVAVKFEKIF